MNEKTDLRIIKTKKILFETLLKLMKQKNFDKIKISDICEEALINRSTFYAHYQDKYELLDDLVEDLKVSLLKDLENYENNISSKEYIMRLLSILIDHIDEKKDIYSAILLNNYGALDKVKDIHMSMYIGEDNKPQSWVNDYDIWYGAAQ